MNINFKIAVEKDIPEILDMMEAFNDIDNYPFNKTKRRENLLEFIRNENLGVLWLILDNDTTIGYIVLSFGFSFEFNGRDAFIDELFLKATFRNQGIGGKTMDFVHQQGVSLGVKAIHLEVEEHNQRALKLYTGTGYKYHNRTLLTKVIN